MEPRHLEQLLSGAEPEFLRNWLAPVKFGLPLTQGSLTPALGTGWQVRDGLWVPSPGPQPIDFAIVYLVLSDYAPDVTVDSAVNLVSEILATTARDELLVALVHLLHIEADPALSAQLATGFAEGLQPEFSDRLKGAVDTRQASPRRFLSRQGVLQAMKAALAAQAVQRQSGIPVGVAAVLLVHSCSMLLGARTRGNRDALMMEMVRNFEFNKKRDLVVHISDHTEMWDTYGDQAVRHAGEDAGALVRRFTGLDVRDFIAFAFAVAHRSIAYTPGGDVVVDATLPGVTRPSEDVSAFVGGVAATPEELAAEYSSMRDGPWNFLPFKRHPVLRLPGGRLVVLHHDLLFDRVTDGLYWTVHDGLRDTEGDEARVAWTRAYGDMVESFVTRRFADLAPTGLDDPAFHSEDDLKRAYPHSKVSDGVIDMGSIFVPLEVVSGRLTVASLIHGEIAAFRRDTEKVVMKKTRQLDAVSKALLRNERSLTGRAGVYGRRVQPVLVTGAGYPVEPFSATYVRGEAEREGLFDDPRIEPLAIISLDELSMLVGLAHTGHAPDRLLGAWQESDIGKIALRNWLLYKFPHAGQAFRPPHVQHFWQDLDEDMVYRLGLRGDA